MQVSDVTTYARTLLAEPNASQRWSDATLISFTDRAQKLIVRDLRWPPGRQVFSTAPSVPEYQLQECIRIMRVYVNGQPIVATDIPTLEGQQIQLNDQTASGSGPSGMVAQGAVASTVASTYAPQWTSQAPEAYPVASSLGYPSPGSSPWIVGQRPRYYIRGGNIGFVPIPIASYPVAVDCVRQPSVVVNLTDDMDLPDIALDAVAWKVCELAYFSDRSEAGSSDVRNYAMTEYEKAIMDLRSWRRRYDGQRPRGPQPLTYRSFYTRGQNRSAEVND